MPCFKRNWFRADLREMARSCSNLQQVDRLHKYAESSTIKVFYRGSLWVHVYQYVVFAYGDISHVSAENVTDIFSLRQAIDGQKSFRILSAEEKLSLNEQLLAARADGISDHIHIMEIKTSQILVENNICPRCRIPLERRTGEDGVYYACPHCKFVKK